MKKAPGFSVSYMDRKADPHSDFYRYANGRWLATHPLPPDKSRYGSFSELAEWNLLQLKKVAEGSATDAAIARGGNAALVGKFYRSALDQNSREKKRFKAVDDLWKLAEGVGSPDDVVRAIPSLHRGGVGGLFSPFSKADDKNSDVYAFFIWQGGISLPDRDYYLSANFAEARRGFLAHMKKMFGLSGLTVREAKARADAVLSVETAIAKASRSRTDLRDPVRNYNRMEVSNLDERYPTLSLSEYISRSGVNRSDYVVMGQPEFFTALDSLLTNEEVDSWRAYLSWRVLTATAPYAHKDVEDEDFEFFRRQLLGQKKQEAKWKTALKVVDGAIGEALGALYVAEYFPDQARTRAEELVADLSRVFEAKLRSLSWMTEATRAEALEKFKRFRVKIGHPAKFRDYSALKIESDDFAGNVRRASAFEFDRQAVRVGKEVDKEEWFMSPPTVNAYYSAESNEIVFPAGILQPPFFDFKADDAVNYGGIGGVIGHEITHGYDDQGRQYDSKGNLRDWWTKADEKAFKSRAARVVDAYSALVVMPGLKLNGELTQGENIADLGGVSIAYEALQHRLNQTGRKNVDGLTPEQRFFISWGQVWREAVSKQEVKRLITVDPHSPGKVRGVVPVMDHPAFDQAFPTRRKSKGQASAPRIGIW